MLRFVESIKEKYRERLLVREEQWPPVRGEKLINLQLVETDKVDGFRGGLSRKRDCDNECAIFEQQMSQDQRRGSLKRKRTTEKETQRTPILYSDLFKVGTNRKPVRKLLIEGNGGMGKTTLCTILTEGWAEGKILENFKCVLLLPLRENKVSSAESLSDLLKLLHGAARVRQSVAEEFEDTEGTGVLIIADGWDELDEDHRSKKSFLYNLLFGDVIPLASVLLTSRPSASAPLHKLRSVNRLVEVVGFNKDDIHAYIRSEFEKEPKKAEGLMRQLQNNPLIQSVCSVPLNCAITCNLWYTLEQELPPTMTELYTKIILNVILRDMKKKFPDDYEDVLSLKNFDSIPSDLRPYWWRLCEFAFNTLSEDKIVFSHEELSCFCPEALDSERMLECFGLMQSAQSLLPVGHGLSFHFLHLTFHEFLAAMHLIMLSSNEQLAVCRSHAKNIRFSMVWKFFFGLGCQKSTGDHPISCTLAYVNDHVFDQLLQVLSRVDNILVTHCAFEAKSETLSYKVATKYLSESFKPRTPHDCVAVLHAMSHMISSDNLELRLEGCNLDDEQLKKLTNILDRSGDKLQIDELDLDRNKLTQNGVTDLSVRAFASFASLTVLKLKENNIDGDCVNSLLSMLINSSCKSLSKLALSQNPLGVPGIEALTSGISGGALPNLKKLQLANTFTIDPEINAVLLVTLAEALSTHHLELSQLDLSQNNLGVPGAQAIAGALPQLLLEADDLNLNLSETMLGDDGVAALGTMVTIQCKLGQLQLKSNNIQSRGVCSLLYSKLTFEVLMLDSNPLDPYEVLHFIENASGKKNYFDSLSLQQCNFVDYSACQKQMPAYGNNLLVPQSSNSIGLLLDDSTFDAGGTFLLKCLCTSVVGISIANCHLTSNDLSVLLSQVSQHFSLPEYQDQTSQVEQIFLFNNDIDDEGVAVLIKNLNYFPRLDHVDLENNRVSAEMLTELRKRIRQNRQGYRERKKQAIAEFNRTHSLPQNAELIRECMKTWDQLLERLIDLALEYMDKARDKVPPINVSSVTLEVRGDVNPQP